MKIIDIILNRYYTNKFLDEVKDIFLLYYLDYKFEKKKNGIEIMLKPIQYKDMYWRPYYFAEYQRGLYCFANADKFIEDFKKHVKEFKEQF